MMPLLRNRQRLFLSFLMSFLCNTFAQKRMT